MNEDLLPSFDRTFFDGSEQFTVIGTSSIGGKARGLADIRRVLSAGPREEWPAGVEVAIPTLVVISTEFFDQFLEMNHLHEIVRAEEADDTIARAFQQGSLPVQLVGDLQALISKVHLPLAVRSSSLLEDAMDHPFAGVYATKMLANNQYDADIRFRKLLEAIKFVYASTFFREARDYIQAVGRAQEEEKMAVIIQEVVGRKHGHRFYPHISGVARSYNFYPTGSALPADGVVSLALGLGKTIVDGGLSWTYSPAWPKANPPYNTLRDLLNQTQTRFWSVNMGPAPEYDPINEAEFLVQADLEAAEEDEVLGMLASTFDLEGDRLVPHMGKPGPRVLTFAPLLVLDRLPLNDAIRDLLQRCERAVGAQVEIEFAVNLPDSPAQAARLGFLQVRSMVVSTDAVDIPETSLSGPDVLAASDAALGNGRIDDIADVVYLKPESFDPAQTRIMAADLERINRALAAERRPYLLIGFGRWGTSDDWLGVPVQWAQISGARAIVESSLPDCDADPSQGSHFFHNVTSFRVLYYSIKHTGRHRIDWDWLAVQKAVAETAFVRHVRTSAPLSCLVDGRTGRGVIQKGGA